MGIGLLINYLDARGIQMKAIDFNFTKKHVPHFRPYQIIIDIQTPSQEAILLSIFSCANKAVTADTPDTEQVLQKIHDVLHCDKELKL